jgi:hypothetical protein
VAAPQSPASTVMRSRYRCLRRSRELTLGCAVAAAVGDNEGLSTTRTLARLDDAFTLDPLLARVDGDDDDDNPDAEASTDATLRVPGSLRLALVVGRLVDDDDDGDAFFFETAFTLGLRVVEPGEMSISAPSWSNARVHEPWWLAVGEAGDAGDASTLVAAAAFRSVGAGRAGREARSDSSLSWLLRFEEAILWERAELRLVCNFGSSPTLFTFELGFDSESLGGSVFRGFALSFLVLLGDLVDRAL